MTKKAKELSALAVSKLKADGDYYVGGADGLYLRIVKQSRVWCLRLAMGTRINKAGKTVPRRLNMGLGAYQELSLAEAREIRKQIKSGIDPLEAKHARKAAQEAQARKQKTFSECAEAVIEIKSNELKNKKHVAQWRSTLVAALGSMNLLKFMSFRLRFNSALVLLRLLKVISTSGLMIRFIIHVIKPHKPRNGLYFFL